MFEGKGAVVTGAGRGMGRATALALGKRGAGVAVVDIHEANGQQTATKVEQCGVPAMAITTDVSDSV